MDILAIGAIVAGVALLTKKKAPPTTAELLATQAKDKALLAQTSPSVIQQLAPPSIGSCSKVAVAAPPPPVAMGYWGTLIGSTIGSTFSPMQCKPGGDCSIPVGTTSVQYR
jgi:hypothetical protein